eukprot:c12805_g1_i6.p2 GENE.c12805_g1_i6~~c12805_g1_i6.p2  ORF type:complete len:167 (-),score=34.17 c12805_g1_i6:1042-1542(-)
MLAATYIKIWRRRQLIKHQMDEPFSDRSTTTSPNISTTLTFSNSPPGNAHQQQLQQTQIKQALLLRHSLNNDVLSKIDTNRILLRFTLFVCVLVAVNSMGSVDRHRHFVDQQSPDAITFAHGILDSLQGLLHVLVYGTTSQVVGAHRQFLFSRRVSRHSSGVLGMT